MNYRLSQLADRFRGAEAAVDASQERLRKRSAARLAELLDRPPRQRLQSLGDPGLTLFDREQLERSVEVELPRYRSRRVTESFFNATKVERLFFYYKRFIVLGLIAFVPIMYFGSRAVLATPSHAVPVVVETPLKVNWFMPDGYRERQDISAESDEVWVLVNGHGQLRRWVPGRGYKLSGEIPDNFWTDGFIKTR